MAKTHEILAKAIFFFYLIAISKIHQSASSKPIGFSFKLIYRDSKESPLYPGNLNESERIERLVSFSKSRSYYLESLSNFQNSITYYTKTTRPPVYRDTTMLFMADLGIGNTHMYLAMDTGSGLIWTQCKPCKKCYNQVYPIYDSKGSNTYQKLNCNHTICRSNPSIYKCYRGECTYKIKYASGGTTKGVLSLEKFKFSSSRTTFTHAENIVFGCSNYNEKFAFQMTGRIAGILGLSLEQTSLVAQLPQTSMKFSYCFVPFTNPNLVSSVMRFGSDITTPSGNVQATTILDSRLTRSILYHLNLIDISIGSRRLHFATNAFKASNNGGIGGFVVDTGTTITRINKNSNGVNAYANVIRVFENHFSNFELRKIRGGRVGFEVCYEFRSNFTQYASMTFHFSEGANYVVDSKYVYIFDNARRYFCVAILPGKGFTILGAYQQQNMRMIYNVGARSLQFVYEDCTRDHL